MSWNSKHISGLSQSEKKALERLTKRRFEKEELVSRDVAVEILQLARKLKRRIGLLVSRDGEILDVLIGTKDILYLPDLGRFRVKGTRLRRIRLIFTDLSTKTEEAIIPQDIFTDLEKLRLDAVIAIKEVRNRVPVAVGILTPQGKETPYEVFEANDLNNLDLDFEDKFLEAESELSKRKVAHSGKVRALLVGVYGKGEDDELSMAELRELARTADLEVLGEIRQKRTPDPKTLIGKGKIEELILEAVRCDAELLVFDTELKPSQWRSITNATEYKVIDRSMLILDIFARRATSSEGRLQVELAQLKYNLPKLVEKDTGLSRLTGGIGGQGPGETKLEIGRRRIREKITFLEKQISTLTQQRKLRTKRREEGETALVSIIGYTNVGKSSLFNALTKSDVIAENKLFATLDPSKRKVFLGLSDSYKPQEIVLADTVGFIRNLPKELFNAFRATLDEIQGAKLLVHVLDASDKDIKKRYDAVRKVINDLEVADVKEIIVLNKIDKISADKLLPIQKEYNGIPISVIKKQNLSDVMSAIHKELFTHDEYEYGISSTAE